MGKSKSHTCLVCCSMTKPIQKSFFILLETIFSVCLLKAGRSTPYHPHKQHYCDKKFCTINFIVSPYIAFLFITWRGRCNDLCAKQDNNKSSLGVKCPGAWSTEISLWAASSLLEVITRGMDWPLWHILLLNLNISTIIIKIPSFSYHPCPPWCHPNVLSNEMIMSSLSMRQQTNPFRASLLVSCRFVHRIHGAATEKARLP